MESANGTEICEYIVCLDKNGHNDLKWLDYVLEADKVYHHWLLQVFGLKGDPCVTWEWILGFVVVVGALYGIVTHANYCRQKSKKVESRKENTKLRGDMAILKEAHKAQGEELKAEYKKSKVNVLNMPNNSEPTMVDTVKDFAMGMLPDCVGSPGKVLDGIRVGCKEMGCQTPTEYIMTPQRQILTPKRRNPEDPANKKRKYDYLEENPDAILVV